jgi:hypothetical protein
MRAPVQGLSEAESPVRSVWGLACSPSRRFGASSGAQGGAVVPTGRMVEGKPLADPSLSS